MAPCEYCAVPHHHHQHHQLVSNGNITHSLTHNRATTRIRSVCVDVTSTSCCCVVRRAVIITINVSLAPRLFSIEHFFLSLSLSLSASSCLCHVCRSHPFVDGLLGTLYWKLITLWLLHARPQCNPLCPSVRVRVRGIIISDAAGEQ